MRFETYLHMQQHPIAADYAGGKPEAAARFDAASPYAEPERAWGERARRLDAARSAAPAADRGTVAAAVLRYNQKHNNAPAAIRAAERLADPRALVVVGGQQAGLFTGPMLVVYKAMTILRTAQVAEERLGRPVVPLFWIAGEDHDWDEANHTYAVAPNLELRKVAVTHPAAAGRTAVSRTEVSPDAWAEAIDSLAGALQDTEFKPKALNELRRIAETSATLSDAFAKTMSLLFGERGLVLIDSDDAGLRAAEGPMFRELIRRREELSEALASGERAVAAHGYPLQAQSAPDGYNLFVYEGGERKLLFSAEHGAAAADRKGTFSISRDDLLRRSEQQPETLSNNALTRPLMQEFVFPTLATVLGAAEIAYWSTLKEAFALFGFTTPIIVPRQQYTLLEGTVQKQMDKFELSFDDAWRRFEERRDEWLRAQDEARLADQFAAAKQSFADMYAPLVEAASAVNPGLQKLGETNMGKILEQIGFLEAKTLDAMKQRHEAGLRQWERIRMTVAPGGKPQERVVNIFQYVVKYGFDWLDELIDSAELDFAAGWRPHETVYL